MKRQISHDLGESINQIEERLRQIEQQAEMIKTVLMVKEAGAVLAADAYEGLRKQVIASSSERRAHLGQLVAMSVAVSRSDDVADVRSQVKEWLAQSGIREVWEVPTGTTLRDLFELVGGDGDFEQSVEILEPAYIDGQTGVVLRLGRANTVSQEEFTVSSIESSKEGPANL
ncbi:MAG: hypothetical protein HKL82_05805 [Acidimicrobiaceae bacterium]|nr:hypothetical protein [Acidimicrobiaceae bacterium]